MTNDKDLKYKDLYEEFHKKFSIRFEGEDIAWNGHDLANAERKEWVDYIWNEYVEPNHVWVWLENELEKKDKKIKALEGECIKILHDYMKSSKAKDKEIKKAIDRAYRKGLSDPGIYWGVGTNEQLEKLYKKRVQELYKEFNILEENNGEEG